MNLVQAIVMLTTLLGQVEAAVKAARTLSDLIKTARDEGRDLTQEELEDLLDQDDAARELLEQAIQDAENQG